MGVASPQGLPLSDALALRPLLRQAPSAWPATCPPPTRAPPHPGSLATGASALALQALVIGGALLQVFSRGAKFSLFKPAEEMVYIGAPVVFLGGGLSGT